MIYVCVTAKDDAASVGLLLWKVRQVFTAFPREYQLLVADDGSSDGTAEVLDRYQRALPMSIVRAAAGRGSAAALESLLRDALQRSDRPRRDVALAVPSDFTVSPDGFPDLLRRIDSGADLVVGERSVQEGAYAHRWVCRLAPWLLRPGIRVAGVRDLLSGCVAIRLATVRTALEETPGPLFQTDGLAARAELVARVAAAARQVATVPLPRAPGVARRPAAGALTLAVHLYRSGRRLRLPPVVVTPAPASRSAPERAVS